MVEVDIPEIHNTVLGLGNEYVEADGGGMGNPYVAFLDMERLFFMMETGKVDAVSSPARGEFEATLGEKFGNRGLIGGGGDGGGSV